MHNNCLAQLNNLLKSEDLNHPLLKIENINQNTKIINFSTFEQYWHYQATGRKLHTKVKFSLQEDELLKKLVRKYGDKDKWNIIAKKMTIVNRNKRQCKERWFNYLSPDVNYSPMTLEEDNKLEELYSIYGAKWVQISKFFPSRTNIFIRSRWKLLQRRKKKDENMHPTEKLNSNDTENIDNHKFNSTQTLLIDESTQVQSDLIDNNFFDDESFLSQSYDQRSNDLFDTTIF